MSGLILVTIYVKDIAENEQNPFVITAQKDTLKPVIAIERGNSATHQVGISIIKLGISGIEKVYVTCDNGVFVERDITSSYTEGIKIPRNGAYTYILVNKAGVASDPVSITITDLSDPPTIYVEGFDGKGITYVQDIWSNSEVNIYVFTDTMLLGKANYEYSFDGGETYQSEPRRRYISNFKSKKCFRYNSRKCCNCGKHWPFIFNDGNAYK